MLALLSCFVAATILTSEACGTIWFSVLLGHQQMRVVSPLLALYFRLLLPAIVLSCFFQGISTKPCPQVEVVCFISTLSSYQLFELKKLFLHNSENISSERWCVFVWRIHIYLSLCEYINVHCCVQAITVNSTKRSRDFIVCVWFWFGVFLTVRRANLGKTVFLWRSLFSPCYSDDLLLILQY